MTKSISESRGKLGDKTLSKKRNNENPKIRQILDAAELVLRDYFSNGIPKQQLMLALKKSVEDYKS